VAHITSNFDEGAINYAVDQGCDRARDAGATMSGWHSGQIQHYLRAVAAGMVALVILYAWLG
jgi:hypothetical protein